ncbi:MAG: hypothetical protein RLZ13_1892 [Bacteroidota bacterium]|jgi:hypothetical protein
MRFYSFFLLFCLGLCLPTFAQDAPWFRYDLTYYKIQTATTGIYRIPASSLAVLGIPFKKLDPRYLRLYHRGKEVAVWVEGEEDGRLDSEDYLDFLGLKNEEWLSTGIAIPNPYVNTFSDTTAFFLAFTPGEKGKRMELTSAPDVHLPGTEQFEVTQLQVFADQYALGKMARWGLRSSTPKEGQGWMSSVIAPGLDLDFQLDSTFTKLDSQSISLVLGWVGRSPQEHVPLLWLGTSSKVLRTLPSPQFSGFESLRQTLVFQQEDIQEGKLKLHLAADPARNGDYFSLAFAQLTYSLPKGKVGARPTPRRFTVEAMQPIRFRDYRTLAANYLLVGHRLLEQPSLQHANPLQAYASYRASAPGGSFDTLVLRMEELYDQFAFGERTPWALNAFLKFYWPIHRPQYLLLAGRSIAPFAQAWVENASVFYRNAPQSFEFQDLVPAAGFPASDSYFVKGLKPEEPELSAMAVGRIPSKSSQDLSNYLDKVIDQESSGKAGPQRILHLVGGINPAELVRHSSYLAGFAALAKSRLPEVEVTTYTKETASEVQRIDLSKDLNAGVSLITYFGHGSLSSNELDFGYVSDSNFGYANARKYPLLLINGCEYANAFGPSYSQGEDWLLTPQKGAIGVLSTSSLGVDLLLKRYTEIWYKQLFAVESAAKLLSLGDVMLRTEREFLLRYGPSLEHQAQLSQYLLLGDPAVRILRNTQR